MLNLNFNEEEKTNRHPHKRVGYNLYEMHSLVRASF